MKRYLHINLLIGTFAATSLLVACGSQSTQSTETAIPPISMQSSFMPAWVNSAVTQKNGDLYGVGSAEIYGDIAIARKRAMDDALMDMVSKLKVEISGKTTSATYERKSNNTSSFEQLLSHEASSKVAPVELLHVEQKDVWHDEKNKRIYVLAYLNTATEASNIRTEVAQIESTLNQKFQRNTTLNTLNQLQALLPALSPIQQQSNLYERYTLLTGKSLVKADNSAASRIKTDVNDLFDRLKVTLKVQGSQAPSALLESGLTASLASMGIKLSKVAAADISVVYSFDQEMLTKGDTFYALSHSRVQFLSGDEKVLLDVDRNSKAASTIPSRAEEKSVKKLSMLISKDFSSFFSKTL